MELHPTLPRGWPGPEYLSVLPAAFQAHEQGAESDGELLELELMPIWDAGGSLTLSANVWFLLSFKE